MTATDTRAWFREFLAPLAPIFREVAAISLFVNLLALAVPVFVLQVYDRVVFHAGVNTLTGLVIGMIAVVAFDFVLRQARARIMQTVALRIDVQVGQRLFDKLMALPLLTLESRPAAHWQALFRDVDVVRNTVSGASALLVCDLPFVILFLGLIVVLAPPAAWVLLAILPLFLLVAWRSANSMAAANRDEKDKAAVRDALITEIMAARTTVKALALDQTLRPLWQDCQAATIERAIVRGAKADGYANLATALSMVATIAMTTVGAIAIIEQQLTIGALIAANMLGGRLLAPLNQLVATWRTYVGFSHAVGRLGEAFASATERQVSEVRLPRPKGQIVVEDVSFTYADGNPGTAAGQPRPVINHLGLTVRAGGIHAIVGRNGSGKSTVLKLLQGLYPPQQGRVLLDGADILQFTRAELAGWIGYVPQEVVLLAGTLRDNIAQRHPGASDEEVIRASQAAGAHGFIIELPDGYATNIGEAGARLSAGQRQRVAIARALVGDPPVLLLDEPSSHLDRQAEMDLRATLMAAGQNRTVVMVTHSPVLLGACSDVFVLDQGRLTLAGPIQEILPQVTGGARQHAPEPVARPTSAPIAAPAAARREGQR